MLSLFATHNGISSKYNYTPALISCREQIAIVVEFHTRNYVSWKSKVNILTALYDNNNISNHKTNFKICLPSVTSSSNVPFTCEKHHWISPLPETKSQVVRNWKTISHHAMCPFLMLQTVLNHNSGFSPRQKCISNKSQIFQLTSWN